MKSNSGLSFLIAFIYILISSTFYLFGDVIENGTESTLIALFILPIHLALISGAGLDGQNWIVSGIILLITLLSVWLIVYIILRILKVIKDSISG
jgi:hypothetical protein